MKIFLNIACVGYDNMKKTTLKDLFHNNYFMAIISIVLIVIIVAVSINYVPGEESTNTGQAYLQNVQQGDVIKVERGPGMVKTYVSTAPDAYAYLRNK